MLSFVRSATAVAVAAVAAQINTSRQVGVDCVWRPQNMAMLVPSEKAQRANRYHFLGVVVVVVAAKKVIEKERRANIWLDRLVQVARWLLVVIPTGVAFRQAAPQRRHLLEGPGVTLRRSSALASRACGRQFKWKKWTVQAK